MKYVLIAWKIPASKKEELMVIDKATSEKHFIRIIYDWRIRGIGEDFLNNEDKEKLSRICLALHKEYWQRCEDDIKIKCEGCGKTFENHNEEGQCYGSGTSISMSLKNEN